MSQIGDRPLVDLVEYGGCPAGRSISDRVTCRKLSGSPDARRVLRRR
jgi:hypothetical protein